MKILAIETATMVCGAAIVDGDTPVAERHVVEKNMHAERIMELIDAVLGEAMLKPAELDAIAVSAGPGSFTGLRIGFSVAKGLAYVLEKPMMAVPTLLALATRGAEVDSLPAEYILAAIDARRDEVFCSLYRRVDMMPVWENADHTTERLRALLEDKHVAVTGDGAEKVLAVVEGIPVPAPFSQCSAAIVGRLAARQAATGNVVDPVTAEPLYVKEFYTKAIIT